MTGSKENRHLGEMGIGVSPEAHWSGDVECTALRRIPKRSPNAIPCFALIINKPATNSNIFHDRLTGIMRQFEGSSKSHPVRVVSSGKRENAINVGDLKALDCQYRKVKYLS